MHINHTRYRAITSHQPYQVQGHHSTPTTLDTGPSLHTNRIMVVGYAYGECTAHLFHVSLYLQTHHQFSTPITSVKHTSLPPVPTGTPPQLRVLNPFFSCALNLAFFVIYLAVDPAPLNLFFSPFTYHLVPGVKRCVL